MSGFVINLAALPGGMCRIELRAAARDLQLPGEQWPGDVRGALAVDRTGEKVSVRGRVSTVARLECARCLKEYEAPLDVELTVYADRLSSSRRLEHDLERDEYMKFHDGRQLDLREDAREALLLDLPITPHCREECRGLCLKCGTDLNPGPCACPGS